MLAGLADWYGSFLVRVVRASSRRAGWLLAGAVLLTAAAAYYTAGHLAVNTNTVGMLSPKLPFRELSLQFDKAFPILTDQVVIVIDGETAARADDAAMRLAHALSTQHQFIKSVYLPELGPFWERNGLLYLSTSELWNLSDRLAKAEPFFGTLAQDPSLRGLFAMLDRALGEKLTTSNAKLFGGILDDIGKAADAQLAGEPYRLSWRQELFGGMRGSSTRQFVLVRPHLNYQELRPGARALAAIRHTAAQLGLDQAHGVRVRLTGSIAMSDQEMQVVTNSARLATSISLVLVGIVLVIGLRSPRVIVSVLLTLLMGLAWTAGFATFAIGELNLISVSFAVLFIGLGVDFGIQFCMRYREELGRSGVQQVARTGAASGVGKALTLAAVAAAVSFFSFVPTSYKGLAELGIIAGVSMFVALFANLTVLPALLKLLPAKPPKTPVTSVQTAVRTGGLMHRNRRTILGLAGAAAIASAFAIPHASFDFNPINLEDPNTPAVQTFIDLMKDPDTTPYTIEILAPNLDAAQNKAQELDHLDVVDRAMTLASFVPEDEEQKLSIISQMSLLQGTLGGYGAARKPPTTTEQIAAFDTFVQKLKAGAAGAANPVLAASESRLAKVLERLHAAPGWPQPALKDLQERLVSDLPQALQRLNTLLDPQHVTLANLPHDLRERWITPDGRARVEVVPHHDVRNNEALRRFVHGVRAVAPDATDTPVTLVLGGEAVIAACLEAGLIAVLASGFLLLVVLRSVTDTLLVLLPLALAALLTVASSVVFHVPFNFANVIAMPLMLGLGIAFGIYMVMRKRGERDLVHLLESSTPRAVLFSALTTICSFGTLAFSPHRGMASMGLLLTIALSYALLFSLVVLPAVIDEIESRRPPGGGAGAGSHTGAPQENGEAARTETGARRS